MEHAAAAAVDAEHVDSLDTALDDAEVALIRATCKAWLRRDGEFLVQARVTVPEDASNVAIVDVSTQRQPQTSRGDAPLLDPAVFVGDISFDTPFGSRPVSTKAVPCEFSLPAPGPGPYEFVVLRHAECVLTVCAVEPRA